MHVLQFYTQITWMLLPVCQIFDLFNQFLASNRDWFRNQITKMNHETPAILFLRILLHINLPLVSKTRLMFLRLSIGHVTLVIGTSHAKLTSMFPECFLREHSVRIYCLITIVYNYGKALVYLVWFFMVISLAIKRSGSFWQTGSVSKDKAVWPSPSMLPKRVCWIVKSGTAY